MNYDFWVMSEVICQFFLKWQTHEWKSLEIHITSDQKIITHGNKCIILILTCYFLSWTHNAAKNNYRSLISTIVAKDGLFWLSMQFSRAAGRKSVENITNTQWCEPSGSAVIPVYRIMRELPWITIFGWWVRWFANFFSSDKLTSENHWKFTSRVTKKSLLTVTNVSF